MCPHNSRDKPKRRNMKDRMFGCVLGVLVALTSTTAQVDQAPSEPRLSDYFPASVGMAWTYEKLEPTATGKTRDRRVKCTDVGRTGKAQSILLRRVNYLGNLEVAGTDIYTLPDAGDRVVHNVSGSDLFGLKELTDRPVVLMMPGPDGSATWKTRGKDKDGNVITVSEYKAKFIPTCTTPYRDFENVIEVTEKVYWISGPWAKAEEEMGLVSKGFSSKTGERELFDIKKQYYAPEVGLVKTLVFDNKGELAGPVSSQLTKFQSY